MGQNHASYTSDVLAVCGSVCLYYCLPQQHLLATQKKSRLEDDTSSLKTSTNPMGHGQSTEVALLGICFYLICFSFPWSTVLADF